jgi:hypothetical protein
MKHIILGNGPAGVVAAETLAPCCVGLTTFCWSATKMHRRIRGWPFPICWKAISMSPVPICGKRQGISSLRIRTAAGRVVAVNAEKRTILFEDGHFESYDRS